MKTTNKILRLITGGDWLQISSDKCGEDGKMWIRPTFPEATKMICDVANEEQYRYSLCCDQHHISGLHAH